MRNKLRRQDAVVFPVKANGTKNMASIFFFLSNLDSEILGDDKAIAFQGRSRGIVTMTLTLLALTCDCLHFREHQG